MYYNINEELYYIYNLKQGKYLSSFVDGLPVWCEAKNAAQQFTELDALRTQRRLEAICHSTVYMIEVNSE